MFKIMIPKITVVNTLFTEKVTKLIGKLRPCIDPLYIFRGNYEIQYSGSDFERYNDANAKEITFSEFMQLPEPKKAPEWIKPGLLMTRAVLGYKHFTNRGETKMNIKEVFTIQETDQYKYECLVNTFLENGWEITGVAIKTVAAQKGEWITVWTAILFIENASVESKAKEIEEKALDKWNKLKEER